MPRTESRWICVLCRHRSAQSLLSSFNVPTFHFFTDDFSDAGRANERLCEWTVTFDHNDL